jgi:hypothetical protein
MLLWLWFSHCWLYYRGYCLLLKSYFGLHFCVTSSPCLSSWIGLCWLGHFQLFTPSEVIYMNDFVFFRYVFTSKIAWYWCLVGTLHHITTVCDRKCSSCSAQLQQLQLYKIWQWNSFFLMECRSAHCIFQKLQHTFPEKSVVTNC